MRKVFLILIILLSTTFNQSIYTTNIIELNLLWSLPSENHIRDVAFSDFDRDGIKDIAACRTHWEEKDWSVIALKGLDGKILWKFSDIPLVSQIEAIDVNGDGTLDIIICGWSEGELWALDGRTGNSLWKMEFGSFVYSVRVVDLEGDGTEEILIGNEGSVVVLDRYGKQVWKSSSTGIEGFRLALGYINDDYVLDIALIDSGNLSSTHATVYVVDGEDGSTLWNFACPPFFSDEGGLVGPNGITVSDINQDARDDVVVAVDTKESNNIHSYEIFALNGQNGSIIWNTTYEGYGIFGMISGRIDGDTIPDVVASGNEVAVFDGKNGSKMWESDRGSEDIEIYDINRDGKNEVITEEGIHSGSDGDIIIRYPFYGTPIGAPMVIGVADVTGDGFEDIVLGHHPGTGVTVSEIKLSQVEEQVDNDHDSYNSKESGGDDCNDNDPNVYPGASEVCDSKDNDCDGQIDEGFDKDSDGYTTCNGDCNDSDSSVNSGAPEICNDNKDNDCDGYTDCSDSDCSTSSHCDHDNDKDGYDGTAYGGNDCNDNDSSINPGATEICDDTKDNDCDGSTDCSDSDCSTSSHCDYDKDDDGYNSTAYGGNDCDDNDPDINPGATEICDDNKDNDCDGSTDCSDPDCANNSHCIDKGNLEILVVDHEGKGLKAIVYMNGSYKGETDSAGTLTISNLEADKEYTIRAEVPGYSPKEKTVTVQKNTTKQVKIQMENGEPPWLIIVLLLSSLGLVLLVLKFRNKLKKGTPKSKLTQMYCPHCGNKVERTWDSCLHCGCDLRDYTQIYDEDTQPY
jgi:hypothetical protein